MAFMLIPPAQMKRVVNKPLEPRNTRIAPVNSFVATGMIGK
jgi:hypothetical protein